jgi:hypothetical protein
MAKIPKQEFELAAEGTHNAVCCAFIDLGTQTVLNFTTKEEEEKRQCVIAFHLVNEKTKTGKNVTVRQTYTYTQSTNGNLFKVLQSWLGIKNANDIEVDTLVGKSAMVTVAHSENGQYANIKAVTGLAKGVKPFKSNEPQICVLLTPEDFDAGAFNELSEKMQGKIADTKEYLAASSPKKKTVAAKTVSKKK